jgi:eukaryotic-like serine/threonine-protein kinase
MPLAPGTKLGPYEISAPLGAGGMGEVYRARDTRLERDVAVKVLPDQLAGDPTALARFEREAKVLAALSHPNILTIFDVGSENDISFVVMELLPGETLFSRIAQRRSGWPEAIRLGIEIADGLSAAHSRGIIHRDLKPENIFLTRDGHIKILDFGLAKLVETGSSDGDATLLTSIGVILGTVGYMSPEQLRGQTIDCRSDIFSFGAIFYEMLTGKRAFRGATQADTISAILKEDPENLWELIPNAPSATPHIVRHCLEKRPEDRFQTARDLLFDLNTLSSLSGTTSGRLRRPEVKPPPNRRLWAALAGVVILVLMAQQFFCSRSIGKGPCLPITRFRFAGARSGLRASRRTQTRSSTAPRGAEIHWRSGRRDRAALNLDRWAWAILTCWPFPPPVKSPYCSIAANWPGL